jgi:hypothetical protein
MQPFMIAFIPAAAFFLSIIGGIIFLAARDTEHPHTRPR